MKSKTSSGESKEQGLGGGSCGVVGRSKEEGGATGGGERWFIWATKVIAMSEDGGGERALFTYEVSGVLGLTCWEDETYLSSNDLSHWVASLLLPLHQSSKCRCMEGVWRKQLDGYLHAAWMKIG